MAFYEYLIIGAMVAFLGWLFKVAYIGRRVNEPCYQCGHPYIREVANEDYKCPGCKRRFLWLNRGQRTWHFDG